MKNPQRILALCVSALVTALAHAASEPPIAERSGAILADWFGIDVRHTLNASREPLPADDIGQRFRIEFDSDDGQRVNGILAMPPASDERPRLALAMHPMGSEQEIWWGNDNPISAGRLSATLREQGFAVLALDARRHGERVPDELGVRDILERARSDHPRLYLDMIIGSVRDYRHALMWVSGQDDLDSSSVLVLGYSMGAQMSLLLAAYEPSVDAILAMVPPYVNQPHSAAAPRHHVSRIGSADIMLLAANSDPYSSVAQTRQVFDTIASQDKTIEFFDSEHVLPSSYLETALSFIERRGTGTLR